MTTNQSLDDEGTTPAERFRTVVESAGFTIEGLHDDLTHKQASTVPRLMLASAEVRRGAQR